MATAGQVIHISSIFQFNFIQKSVCRLKLKFISKVESGKSQARRKDDITYQFLITSSIDRTNQYRFNMKRMHWHCITTININNANSSLFFVSPNKR